MNNFKLKRNITKLLLCGGGFKFYYLYGSLKYLHEINVIQNVTEYIGVSAGAMLSLLLLLGYTPDELNKFILEFQFDKLIVPHIDNLLDKKGLDDGEILKFTMQQFLIKKKYSENIKFSDLFQKTNKKLVFIASNITKNKLEIIDHTTYPNMSICQGILITSALPLLFQPVLYDDNYLIDGGVFDNYPIDLFLDENILGINLSTNLKIIDFNIDFFNYMTKLFMISHHWKNINKIEKYKKYTIEIKTYDSSELLNTELSIEEKNRRILYGYDCAKNHIEEFEIEDEEEEEEEEVEENKNVISNEELIKKVSSIDYII
jgi:NTE family protein